MKWSISQKLLGPLLIGGTALMVILSVVDVRLSTRMMLAQQTAALDGLRASRQTYIENYFKIIRAQMATSSRNRMIGEAAKVLSAAFAAVPEQVAVLTDVSGQEHGTLRTYYNEVFAPRLEQLRRPDSDLTIYIPASASGRALQTMYIAENPEPVGQKGRLDRAAQPCDYNRLHAVYHPRIREFKESFGYYDIFLFDLHGNLVYSVSKETDFATSFINGPHKDTGLAEVYRRARALASPGEVAVVDYSAYLPSYGAPASFIAAPVFHDNARVGVLAFQMPIDQINGIVRDAAGLGQTGRVYLVGHDLLMRSGTRFDTDTIFTQTVGTQAARRVISGDSGTIRQASYDGRQVVASFAPVRIEGLRWGIITEINVDEIAAGGRSLRNAVTGVGLIIGALSLGGVWFLARRVVVNPIRQLAAGANQVQRGNYDVQIDVQSSDEIGDLALAFNHMTSAIRRDIEARRESEAALSEAEQRSRLLLESAPDAMVIVDAAGAIESVNEETERLLGYSREELIGQPIEVLVPQEHRDGHVGKRDAVINDPNHPGLAAGQELAARRKDGTTIPVEISLNRLETNEGLFVLAAVRDITERKKAQEALREREERFSSLVANIPGAVYRCALDEDWTMFYMSDHIVDIAGYPASDFIHNSVRTFSSIIHTDDVKMVSAAVEQGLREKSFYIIEYRIVRADGAIRWVYEKGKLIHADEYLDGVIFDITERKQAEEALHKSEERFDLTVRGSGDGLWDHDPATGELWYADRFRELLGYSSEEEYPNVVESWSDGLHPEDREATLTAFAAHLERDVPYDVEYRLKTKSGEYRWFRARGISLREATGRSYRAAGSITDITERRQAEEALRERETRYRFVAEWPGQIVFETNLPTNESFYRGDIESATGWRAEDVEGDLYQFWVDHMHPEDRERVLREDEQLARAFQEGRVPPETRYSREYRLISSGGSIVHVEEVGMVLSDSEGRPSKALGVLRNITERKQAEEELQKLSRAVEQSPSTVVITDLNGNIEYVNPKFSDITGYSAEQARGQNPRVLKSGEHPAELYKDLWDTITAGREWRGELCNRRKDGTLYWESASISPVRCVSGQITHFVAVKEDITEKRRIAEELRLAKEAAEAATQAKSDFLANMSHEIRTPMNGIIGMTDLTLDTELTPEQRDYLNTFKTSADALLTLINDILDFSKIEAGKLELEPIDFALRDALADMLNTLANRAHSKSLELVYDVPPAVHDALVGDVYRLRQIIMNLVGNAIKFTEHGEIVVSVAQVQQTDQTTTLQFSVRDTGIGIPPDKLEAIFRPFEQADASTTRQFGGTGLGLTISVQLVELMGGRIWAESQVGHGSTFHFTAVFGLGKASPAPDAQQRRELLEGLPMLVVDDNATNRRILEEMLKNWRMKPQSVADGAAALAALDRAANAGQPFRLVLSDVNMPEMNGFTLFEQVQSNPQYGGVPFILLTSAARPGDVARCREIGVAAHLIKPVKQSLLMNAIATAVGGKDTVAFSQDKPQMEVGVSTADRVLQILLAEDNAVNQKFAVRAIEKAGHSVFVTSNGCEALEAWERDRYDVVLIDVQMPEMDGLQATARIRDLEQQRGTKLRTPIIAMTANAMKGDKERRLDAGMDGYVSKPVKRQTLFAEIERVLEAR